MPFGVPPLVHRNCETQKDLYKSLYRCHVIKLGVGGEAYAHLWFLVYPVGSWMLRSSEKYSSGVAIPLKSGVPGAIRSRLLKC